MKTLTSLAIWGGGGFNNQTGPILVHIYPLIYINLHVKYGSNLIRTFRVKIKKIISESYWGPFHKIQGYRGHQNGSKCRPHHGGDVCTARENNLKPFFSYMVQNVNFLLYFWLFWGALGGGGLQWSDWAYLASQLSTHPYLCTCEIRKQSDKNF